MRAALRPPSLGFSLLRALAGAFWGPFLLHSCVKTLNAWLNDVKVSVTLVTHFVNTSFSKRKKVLTSALLTGVNNTPTPLTLRVIIGFAPTQLRLLSDCQLFCTFADDKKHPFPSPCTRGAYLLIHSLYIFHYGKN